MSTNTQQTTAAPAQLTEWNEARAIAAELIEAFYNGEGDMAEVEQRHEFSFPERPEVVEDLLDLRGRRFAKTDELARRVQKWER